MSEHYNSVRLIAQDDGYRINHPKNGAEMRIKIFSADSGGLYSMMETVLPPGAIVPLHTHANEVENNLILAGTLTMEIGDDIYFAEAGSYVVSPKGIKHRLKNDGTTDCRFVTTFMPGGAEGFFEEAFELMRRAAPQSPDQEEMLQLQRKYGLHYL